MKKFWHLSSPLFFYDPDDEPGIGQGDQPGDQDPGGEKTFSQSEVNQMMQERLARQKRSLTSELESTFESKFEEKLGMWREENGLTDDALQEFSSRDKASAELRKLKAQHTRASNEAGQWKEKYESLAKGRRHDLTTKALIEAASGVARSPAEIAALLSNRVMVDESDWTAYVVDENGEVSGQSIGELVKDYVAKNDHHMPPTGGRGSGSRVTEPGESRGGSVDKTSREYTQGLLSKLYGGT